MCAHCIDASLSLSPIGRGDRRPQLGPQFVAGAHQPHCRQAVAQVMARHADQGPAASFIGGFSSTLGADFVARALEPFLCPEGSTAEIVTSPTTMRRDGREVSAINYEMQCVDANGTIVRAPSQDYAYYWVGLLMMGSLGLSGLLALLLAAPLGALVMRLAFRKAGTA